MLTVRAGRPESERDSSEASEQRSANVTYASDLLETEISQRNARKDAQESTARWIVLTAGALMTLLLTLSSDAGILDQSASDLVHVFFVGTLAAATGAAIGAIGALWPRLYDRLGKEGLGHFNQKSFLDRATHEVTGQVVATRIGIARTMDENHEAKATWLKAGFVCVAVALVCLTAQGVALALDPPARPVSDTEKLPPRNGP